MNLTKKQIVPAAGLAVIIICAALKIEAKYMILMCVAEACTVLVADPYYIFRKCIPPVSRALIVSATALVTFAVWFHSNAWVIGLPVLIAAIMVLAVIRFNRTWLGEWYLQATVSVKQALVSVDAEHINAWNDYGMRECDTLLRHYMKIPVQEDELEYIYRQVYSLGYVHAKDEKDDIIYDLQEKVAELEDGLENSMQGKRELRIELRHTKEAYEQAARESDEIYESYLKLRDYADQMKKRNLLLEQSIEQMERQSAIHKENLALSEETYEDDEIIGIEDRTNIIHIPTEDERIMRDRAAGMSLSECARKYRCSKGKIQYVERKYREAANE